MNDVETIQRERGWHRDFCCSEPDCDWKDMWRNGDSIGLLPDPLADTSEGWLEFGQIIKWAHEKGWAFVLEIAAHHYCAMVNSAAGWMGNGYGDFRTAIIAALAAAVRPESEAKG